MCNFNLRAKIKSKIKKHIDLVLTLSCKISMSFKKKTYMCHNKGY